jgi:hypothetical protein
MNKHKHLVALALAAAATAPAFAQQALKPGLWQVETRMPSDPEFEKSMADMREQLASMPPEDRKHMEAMMAKQGVQFGAGAKGGTATRFCMTREQAERKESPGAQGDCKVTKVSRSGNTVRSGFTCSNPRSTGESVVRYASAEAYNSKTTTVTEQGGRKDTTVIESDAKWLSSDCGAVKPLAPKAR